jgi:PAS domain S-box-containing protein
VDCAADSLLMAVPLSFFQDHKLPLMLALGVGLALAFVIILLTRNISRRKASERELRQACGALLQKEEALRAAQAQMEQRVEARTAELARANESLRAEITERQHMEERLGVLSKAVEHSPVAIVITNLQGEIEYVNPKFTQTTGYTRAEALGKNPRILKSGNMPPETYKSLWETVTVGGEWTGELQNRRKNGELFWENAVITGLRDASGKVSRFVALKLDITAQKLAQEALRESEERSRAIYESSNDAIMLLTERGFFDCNQKTLEMFGFASKDEFVKCHPGDLSPPEQPNGASSYDAAKEKIQEAFNKGHSRFEWLHRSRTGGDFPAEVLLSAFNDRGRQALQATVRNISHRKQAENALRASEERTNAILEAVPAGIFIVDDASGKIVSVNPAAVAMLGMPPENIVNAAWQVYIKPNETGPGESASSAEKNSRSRRVLHIPPAAQIPVLVTEVPLWLEGQDLTLVSFTDISELQRAEVELAGLNRQLVDSAREAGMADVASAVLHNVGNVLNSVNVSTTLISQAVQNSKVASVHKVAELIQAHAPDLGRFFAEDPRGQRLPPYLEKLSGYLREEQALLRKELDGLVHNIDHIKEIVSMQQAYASTSGVVETVSIADLLEDAVRLNAAAFSRHDVEVLRDFQDRPVMRVDRHKVLQILVNLLRNAKYALDECAGPHRRLTLQIRSCPNSRIQVVVMDNGVGIPPENITRIFARGFTTRKDGHGFGLHSGALAAKEMGGSLTVHSAGAGQGASFTLDLPVNAATKGAL